MISPTAMSQLVAEAIYGSSNDRECRWLHLEWAIDFFIALDAADQFKMALESYDALISGNHTEQSPFVYNDLDCKAWVFDWKENWKAFAHEGQSRNYIYVLQKNNNIDEFKELSTRLSGLSESEKMAVYRYWKVKPEDPDEQMDDEDYYSDCPDGKYGYGPDRPTLEWLIENDGSKYNDCRDASFIIKTADLLGRADNTSWKMNEIHWALFNINSLWTSLQEPQ